MQALVINMKSSTDRWDFMEKQLQSLGIFHSRLEAFDVGSLSHEKLKMYSTSWERPLRKAEVSCFLSHKSAWSHVVKKDLPFLILEDDVYLGKSTKEVLDCIVDSEVDYGLINLETTNRKKLIGKSEISINEDFNIRRLFHNKNGSAAYIIWPSLAAKLLRKFSNHSAALADAALFTNFFTAKQYQLYPAIAIQLQYDESLRIKYNFDKASTILGEKKNKRSSIFNLIRRVNTQIALASVYIINVFRAKCIKIDNL